MDERPTPTAAQSKELDRVNAFSDCVFAFAITLLVINLEVPQVAAGQSLWDALKGLDDDLQAYVISFVVVGSFWYGHHKVFSLIDRSDSTLIVCNLALLALIAIMPFTTDLLGTYGDDADAAAIYAFNLGAAALADGLIEVVAVRRRLVPEGAMPSERDLTLGAIARAGVFFLSIPLAFLSVTAAMFSWLLLLLLARVGRRFGRTRSEA